MKKTTLILADEDQSILDAMVKNFTDENHEVIATTSNGEELINLIKTQSHDAVIMDIVLQKCDGFKVLESVERNKTNIIIHSALSIDGFIN